MTASLSTPGYTPRLARTCPLPLAGGIDGWRSADGGNDCDDEPRRVSAMLTKSRSPLRYVSRMRMAPMPLRFAPRFAVLTWAIASLNTITS